MLIAPRVLSLLSYQFKLETNGVAFDLRVNFFYFIFLSVLKGIC